MTDTARRDQDDITDLAVPATLDAALDPAWLGAALGTPVRGVETLEVIRTVATKVRFAVDFADGASGAFCLKGLLDVDAQTARGGPTMVLEADFYGRIAAHVDVRVPACVARVVDRRGQAGIILMRDLVTDGARFCSALEAFTADRIASSLEQLAKLHAGRRVLDDHDWIEPRIARLAEADYVPRPMLQEMIDGPRSEGLPTRVRDAGTLIAAVKALAAIDAGHPQTLIHGDCHAGNIFETAEGAALIDWQLLQRGGWALDIAYHINAACDVAMAEREERRLLDHYLDAARALGVDVPGDAEGAWAMYRAALVYGYYLWAITRRVDPAIIVVFFNRLGSAVHRHDSFALLGV